MAQRLKTPVLRRFPHDGESNRELLLPHGKLRFDRAKKSIYIESLQVDKTHRRKGIATQLLQAAAKLLKPGDTLTPGTIVAAPGANEGILRVCQRLCEKYQLTLGHYRQDPHEGLQ